MCLRLWALTALFLPQNMSGERVFGLTIWHCVAFFLFFLASLAWWFPVVISSVFDSDGTGPTGFLFMLICMLGLAACVEFFINFGIGPRHNHSFNSIDNFYEPAACGSARQLKSGILLKAEDGQMYKMMWVSSPHSFPFPHTYLAIAPELTLFIPSGGLGSDLSGRRILPDRARRLGGRQLQGVRPGRRRASQCP